MNDYIISVDAGGTKTNGCAIALNTKEIIAQCCGGAGNLSCNVATACDNIVVVVCSCIQNGNAPKSVIIGAAGVSGFDSSKLISRIKAKTGVKRVAIVSDALLGLYAAFRGENGILCIAGTGSVAYGRNGALYGRYGGWGHLISDEGSGTAIALSAFKQMAIATDNNSKAPRYTQEIMEHFKAEGFAHLVSIIHAVPKGELAAIVPIINKYAENGYSQAEKILTMQGELLAENVVSLCKSLSLSEPQIQIMGGIFKNCGFVRSAFERTVLKGESRAEILSCKADFIPQMGAFYIYKEEIENDNR